VPGNYHLVSLVNVTGFEIVQPAGEGETEQPVQSISKAENDALNSREAHAIRELKKWESTRGKGVSKEAQDIHDHIMRTYVFLHSSLRRRLMLIYFYSLPTRWINKDIIVNECVILEPPYRPENCKAPKDKQAALDQIKKVIEGYWIKKGGKPQTKGPQNTGGNRNTAPVMPVLPRKGG
jgi:protein LSM12